MSTLNRSLCAALAKYGCPVTCLVPDIQAGEAEDALAQSVTLLAASPALGLVEETRLCLPNGTLAPRVVVGHGHITGAIAAARVEHFHLAAHRIHILHTSPEELEWLKNRDGDAARRAEEKQRTEATLAATATLAFAVGPRLTRQWNGYMAGLPGSPRVHRLDPGIPLAPHVEQPPPSLQCLVLGRTEDYEAKGLDVAAACLGRLRREDNYFSGAHEPVLVVRGGRPGTGSDLRSRLQRAAGCELQINVKDYTQDEDAIRQDLARASLLLMPSRAEGFGLVALEALSMGVPILVSLRSGIAELLLERLDAHPSEVHIRRLVVDVKGDLDVDSRAWAEAAAVLLKSRAEAFRDACLVRNALRSADYWRLSVESILHRLPDTHPTAPSASAADSQLALAESLNWTRYDPTIAIVMSTALLESKLSEHARLLGSRTDETAGRIVSMLVGSGALSSYQASAIHHVFHRRNLAVHPPFFQISETEGRDHVREVEAALGYLSGSPL